MRTSRQIISAKQRVSHYQPAPVRLGGYEKHLEGRVVQVPWTPKAPAKVTFKQDVTLKIRKVTRVNEDFVLGEEREQLIPHGATLTLVPSELAGYYYMLVADKHYCSCEHGTNRQLLQTYGLCKHFELINKNNYSKQILKKKKNNSKGQVA